MKLSRLRVSERQALHFIMAACAIGFAGAVLVVSLRRQVTGTRTAKYPLIRWMSPRTSNDLHHFIAELDDPSLISLPNPYSFSAVPWRHQARLEADPIQSSNTIAYLDAAPPQKLATLLPTTPLSDAVRAKAEKPEIAVADPMPIATATLPGNSAIQLNEPLESCRMPPAPALPVVTSETTLRPTVVRFAVASDGTVVHVLLERSCGNDNADAVALAAARQLRFALPTETDRSGLLWGSARFLWATKMP